jgi:hypothetical protein
MTVKGAATLTATSLSGRPHWVQLLIVGVDPSGPSVYSIDSAVVPSPTCTALPDQVHRTCTVSSKTVSVRTCPAKKRCISLRAP